MGIGIGHHASQSWPGVLPFGLWICLLKWDVGFAGRKHFAMAAFTLVWARRDRHVLRAQAVPGRGVHGTRGPAVDDQCGGRVLPLPSIGLAAPRVQGLFGGACGGRLRGGPAV
eukprot:359028-Chlamydomonas_euryale.AAC.6